MSDRHPAAVAFSIALFVGAIALFVLAVMTWPTDAHHGEAIDGLDGLGTFFALAEGAGGVVLLLLAGFVMRIARKD